MSDNAGSDQEKSDLTQRILSALDKDNVIENR